ncbi:VOC family protein [Kordia zhangzhouensis]|uniref:VOC family protein n=1 Tax=Kordia zhangzhouensis TaxID=1620405 RepID=UPI0006291C38|nr:dioxygenase [Kordia zhangzhouensis]
MNAFHYAFKIKNIESTRAFYVDIVGCKEGRSTENWIDFDFFGHQLSGHVSTQFPALDYCGKVDGVSVPIPHFGCLLTLSQFEALQKRLEANSIEFIVKPQIRYEGQKGEQRTMFVFDFSGNPLEFKAFSNENEVFAQ